jgi:hypothetical protein
MGEWLRMHKEEDDEPTFKSVEEAIRNGFDNRLRNLPDYGEIKSLKTETRDRRYTKRKQISKSVNADHPEFLQACYADSVKYGYEKWLSDSSLSLWDVSRMIARRGYRGISENIISKAGYF